MFGATLVSTCFISVARNGLCCYGCCHSVLACDPPCPQPMACHCTIPPEGGSWDCPQSRGCHPADGLAFPLCCRAVQVPPRWRRGQHGRHTRVLAALRADCSPNVYKIPADIQAMLPHPVGVHPRSAAPGFHVFMPRWYRVGGAPPVPRIVPRAPAAQTLAPAQRYAALLPATSVARRNGTAGAACAAGATGTETNANEAAPHASRVGMSTDRPVSTAPAAHSARASHHVAPAHAAALDTIGARASSVASAGEPKKAQDALEVLSRLQASLETSHAAACIAVGIRSPRTGSPLWSIVPVYHWEAPHTGTWLFRELGVDV